MYACQVSSLYIHKFSGQNYHIWPWGGGGAGPDMYAGEVWPESGAKNIPPGHIDSKYGVVGQTCKL